MPPNRLSNTPGGDRTRDLRIWNPLLYQLSYRRLCVSKENSLLTLDFVKGVLAKSWRKLFKAFFHSFGNSALHADFGAVIQVTGFGALKPNIFAIERFFSHDKLQA